MICRVYKLLALAPGSAFRIIQMFLTWGICFLFEDGKDDKCTAVCPYIVWVKLHGPKEQGVLAEGLCSFPAELLWLVGRMRTGQQAVPLPCLLSGCCLAGCFSLPLRLLSPLPCLYQPEPGREQLTWSLENEPVTWRDCAWYGRSLQLKNWICLPSLPAPSALVFRFRNPTSELH